MKIDAWEPKHQGLAVVPWALPDARLSGADLLPGPGRSLPVPTQRRSGGLFCLGIPLSGNWGGEVCGCT